MVFDPWQDRDRAGLVELVLAASQAGAFFLMTLRSTITTIGEGRPGLQGKIRQMERMVADAVRDHDFRQMAVEQLKGLPPRDWDAEINRVVKTVQRMRFTKDPYTPDGLEVFIHPKTMLMQILGGTGYGDCDDHVLLAVAMLEVIGHRTRYRVGGARPGAYQHIWIDVLHPDRGWVPVELIRPEVSVGFDPTALFAHSESYPHEATMTELGLIPSEIIRRRRRHDGGKTAAESGLGWIGALINAVTALGSGYHAGAQNKRARNRQKRERESYAAQGLQAPQQAFIPDVNYAQYVGQLAQSGVALYDEYSYEAYDDAYFADEQRRERSDDLRYEFEGQTLIGPDGEDLRADAFGLEFEQRLTSDQYKSDRQRWLAGEQFIARDFEAEWKAGSADRGLQLQQIQALQAMAPPPSRSRPRDYLPAAKAARQMFVGPSRETDSSFASFLDSGRVNRDRLQSYLDNYGGRQIQQYIPRGGYTLNGLALQTGTGLGGLGEDPPPDPGPWVDQVKKLKMPTGWETIIDSFRPVNQWDKAWLIGGGGAHPTTPKGIYQILKEQNPLGTDTMKLRDAFDIGKYPSGPGGRGGGPDQFAADWGGSAALGESAVQWWVYLFALTHHPKLLTGMAPNWRGVLEWMLAEISAPVFTHWREAEAPRRAQWEAATKLWNDYLRREEERVRQESAEAKEAARLQAIKDAADAAKADFDAKALALREAEQAIRDARTAEERQIAEERAAKIRAELELRQQEATTRLQAAQAAALATRRTGVVAPRGFTAGTATMVAGAAFLGWWLLRRKKR